ncbi:MAG: YicC family protein [Gammaproteobacteria bacterium]|nr:MAG: YicC family protein [Gammaproteobacteria bacterium]
MIRSMTGFARAERATPAGVLTWELRGVNHRYLEASLRLPEELRAAESTFRQAIATVARRGKIDATLTLRPTAGTTRELSLDEPLLDRLIEAASQLQRRLGPAGHVDAVDLLRWPGVVTEPARDPGPLLAAARQLLDEALTGFATSRAAEGTRIAGMLASRAATLLQLVETVVARLPEVQARIRARLQERLTQLGSEVNPERIEQEIAILLQKMDVAEELDRLRSHVTELHDAIASGEAVGRKLDFLMQEFNREANTLSSKSQDIETTRAAVEIKVLVEQMREQVQNVE